MICVFHFNKKEVLIKADRIIGILSPLKGSKGSTVYCDEPLGCITIDESVEDAFGTWFAELAEEDAIENPEAGNETSE